MNRREFLFLIPAAILTPYTYVGASITDARILILKEAIAAIGEAGEAISKLVDGLRKVVTTGYEGYDFVNAKLQRERLLDLSSRNTVSIAVRQQLVVSTLDEYLEKRNPSDADWLEVSKNINVTLETVNSILSDIQKENSELVTDHSFLTLNESLATRVRTLSKLSKITPPITMEERALLTQISQKYKALLINAKKAADEFNAYLIKSKQQQP